MAKRKPKKRTPAASMPGLPAWNDVKAVLDTELKARKARGGSLNSLTKTGHGLKFSTLYTVLNRGDDARWNTIMLCLAAMNMTLPQLIKRLNLGKPAKTSAAA